MSAFDDASKGGVKSRSQEGKGVNVEDGTASGANDAVLTCWKDIAKYLGKGVRTVQRWEHTYGLPVRRPNTVKHKSAVIAYTSDLDAWLESNWSGRNLQNGQDIASLAATNQSVSDLVKTTAELRNLHHELLLKNTQAVATLIETLTDQGAQLDSTRMVSAAPWNWPPPREDQAPNEVGSWSNLAGVFSGEEQYDSPSRSESAIRTFAHRGAANSG